MGRNFLTPGHRGVRVGNVHRKSDRKFVFVLFSFPEIGARDEACVSAHIFVMHILRLVLPMRAPSV